MAARSHIDLCLFVQIIEISASELPDEVREIVNRRDAHALSDYMDKTKDFRLVNLFTEVHESVHTAQAITYPYLRVFAMHAFSQIYQAFRSHSPRQVNLFGLSEDELGIHQMSAGDAEISNRYELWLQKRNETVGKAHNSIAVKRERSRQSVGGSMFVTTSAIDLIENAASIIQFKIMEKNDSPLWLEYIRWCRRNPSNSELIEKLAKEFGHRQVFLDAFPSLIYSAFCTNHPVATFAYLILRLEKSIYEGKSGAFFNQPEPRRWVEVFDVYLDEYEFDNANPYAVSKNTYERFDPYWSSTLRFGGGDGRGMPHPILGRAIQQWGEGERENLAYRYALSYPNGYSQIIWDSSILTSPLRILKFVMDDGSSFVSVDGDLSRLGMGMVEVPGYKFTDIDLRAMFRDFMAIFGYARTFSKDLWDPTFRLCTHEQCPQYERNLCNGWIHIPSDYEDCGFVKHMYKIADQQLEIARDRGD